MLDHRAQLAVMAVVADLWSQIPRSPMGKLLRPLTLPPVHPLVVPLDVDDLITAKPIVATAGSYLLLLPGHGTSFDYVHATLHAAAMLLTERIGKKLYTPSGRVAQAFVGWAAILGLAVEYDYSTGFGRTSLAMDAFARYRDSVVALDKILSAAEARWREPAAQHPIPLHS